MADTGKGCGRALSVLMRMAVSLVLPFWGLAMLVMGVSWGAGWWTACGLVVGAIGVVMLAGSPLAAALLRER
jgi:hypothetical protein